MKVSFVKRRFHWVHVTLIAIFLALVTSEDTENKLTCEEVVCNLTEPCICPSGCTGKNCTEECSQGRWGSNCKNNCSGKCNGQTCNAKTGVCDDGCVEFYIPPDCEKVLAPPDISLIDTDKLRLNYTTELGKAGRHITFEIGEVPKNGEKINWEPLNISLTWKSNYWAYADASEPKLHPMKFYTVRAVLDSTKGCESRFNTTWWKPSVPHDLTVIYFNESIRKLKWKYHGRYWEKTKGFLIGIKKLGTGSLDDSSGGSHNQSMEINEKQNEYNMTLNVTLVENYTLSVNVVDENVRNGDAVKAWYFFPDINNPDIVGTRKGSANDTVTLIRFKIPLFPEKTVNVIMDGSSSCPERLPANGTVDLSEIANLTSNEYPACKLRPSETWVFSVILEEHPTSYLIWLIVLPISALSILTLMVLYRKYGDTIWAVLKSAPFPKLGRDTIPLSRCTKPEDLPPGDSASQKVKELEKFEDYVRRAAENGILQQQFMSLPKGLVRSCRSGKLPQNRHKNRYGNLIAYDASRVILARGLDSSSTDYINASYVQGYCKERAYIATQAPLPETVLDFWTMIWQEDVRIICMLVDIGEGGQNTCERYWPEVGEEIKYGNIGVVTMNQRVSTDFTYRTLTVSKEGARRSRTVLHLQYTGWPEEGIPMYSHSVVEYVHKLLSLPPGQGPIVVHCCTGTGRTGAIILSDICLRRLSAEGSVDVFSEAKTMYSARANMLTNFAQYVLPHLVPTQCLLSIPSNVLCADLTRVKIEEMKKDLPAHIKRLHETSWMDKAMREIQPIRPPADENVRKNRFPKLMPVGDNLVTISRYPTYDTNSDYISAVSVDGPKIRKQYLAAQLPMPSTLTDFWRLIVEKNIELVIILQRPDLDDDTCCDIVPRRTLIPLPHLKVEKKMSESSSEFFTTDQLLLTDSSQEPGRSRTITVLTCNHWAQDQITRPPPPEVLVDLWLASEDIPRPKGHTLVVCYDGVTGCGMYLALSFLLEKMTVEQECDVILAVRAVRRSRPEFVTSQWQFEYLYDAALKYVESFADYANFVQPSESVMQCDQWP